MKKLSFKSDEKKVFFRFAFEPENRLVSNGFSGFHTDGNAVRGSCAACAEHFCMKYSEHEMESEKFAQFPKNPSNRVCPVNAMSVRGGFVQIDEKTCILCGLCLHRCPFAAIQFDLNEKKCYVNDEKEYLRECTKDEQIAAVMKLKKIRKIVSFEKIKKSFASIYENKIKECAKDIPDVSEIIVRNSLTNLGLPCNVNVHGNNHVRIEFFSEKNDKVVFGESIAKDDPDTLSVSRRILDDIAVLMGRYNFSRSQIIPLAVLDGLPNKRADYYEVVGDVDNVLKIKIYTLTYHLLFLLNLFDKKIDEEMLSAFYINAKENSLLIGMKKMIPGIEKIDMNVEGQQYQPIK